MKSLVFCCLWLPQFFTALVAPVYAEDLDISYGDLPEQKLDVYTAADTGDNAATPVVIWVHGGGWRNGDKDNLSGKRLCKSWASNGVSMVNLNYRLTPDVVHPAHVEDVAAGIAWVYENIARFGGNPKRIFLLGHSAGAHLVALVATNPKYLQAHGLVPNAILAGVMPIDTASYDLAATDTRLVRRMIHDAFGDNPETLAEASPLQQVKLNSQTSPPFLIAVTKQRKEAWDESSAFCKALPKCKLIVMDYPELNQLQAHAEIARDLINPENSMTQQLLRFVKEGDSSTPPLRPTQPACGP